MKQHKQVIALAISLLTCYGLQAQRQANYTAEQQAQLDSIKQAYLDRGIPEKSAINRAQAVFESKKQLSTRSRNRNPTPFPGSIWIDRNAEGADYSDYHNYTPGDFIKKIFIKNADKIGSGIDDIIKNVQFTGIGWDATSEAWTADSRSLHYFDHGDATSKVERCWDSTCDSVLRFGMEKGFLLTTGEGLRAEGANETLWDLEGGMLTTNLGGSLIPDVDLQGTITEPLATQTILEFDFKPFADSVTFRYVFASTEYKLYSNSEFNDAFGFFVSGPALTDEWKNAGGTINIARYPNGNPISVNTSNWGFREWKNSYDDYDPLGYSPVKTSGFGPPHQYGYDSTAIHPQYHVPVYSSGYTRRSGANLYVDCDTTLMEYEGHSIVLTAKVKLKRGEWHHMKLAIGNATDDILGSGAFLMAGSFDLGAPAIQQTIHMPAISGAICDKVPGKHTVTSMDDFTFTITPSDNNAGKTLRISTSRTSIPDSEGVIINKNNDGSYTVTIRQIQEAMEIYLDFTTSNEAIENNKSWTNGSKLYIQTDKTSEAQIYTISGMLVCSINLTSGKTVTIELAKGIYIVRINDSYTQKVTIK